MARRKLISDSTSELPVEVKDRILECLPTRDAAKMALLSTYWNDAWLQHGQLVFDSNFIESVDQYCDGEGITFLNIISNILFLRAGPVKKFTIKIRKENNPELERSDFDRWCLFLSRNGVEELNISLETASYGKEYKLPFCLLSCRTIKQLIVHALFIDLPVNAVGIFSNVTSLAFFDITFKRSVNGIASSISIPKLEKLAFELCFGINKFEISPPKLEILSVIGSMGNGVEELSIALVVLGQKYDVRFCILSCPTIRHLNLEGFIIDCPRNAPCIFPSVTLLRFKNVEFKHNANGVVSRIIPNLDKLAFSGSCGGINTFEISAPKLESFSAIDVLYVFEPRWLTFHLKAITTLCLSGLLLSRKPVAAAVPKFPTAVNLQVMKLYELSFGCGKQLTVAMQLIQKCPNLCELGINAKKVDQSTCKRQYLQSGHISFSCQFSALTEMTVLVQSCELLWS
ncbi:PREDICTED: uncharacterized protein LOC109147208 [Ipomoea nil]|uniref:uncharacterized protein LOC109147208 n=1 Tax=Ipomoea nil TaxID=35883 RepID=UPI0009019C49|nr:PREDICTED: uncharacterized protein LOC109147208 [Ipomoea nil]